MPVDDGGDTDMTGVVARPAAPQGLVNGAVALAPGSLVAQAIGAAITVAAKEGREIVFGRQAEQVHVCVGADDLGMSRRHGLLAYRDGRWWVSNVGRRPLRLPTGELHANAEPVPLGPGYTPLFVTGARERQHLLELYVAGPDGDVPRVRHDHETAQPAVWALDPDESLVLVVVGQRYLRHEPDPEPVTWQQAAAQLELIEPEGRWTAKRVEHRVAKVRRRLSRRGVHGLVADEVASPFGSRLTDNLLRELVRSATLVPADLARLDD